MNTAQSTGTIRIAIVDDDERLRANLRETVNQFEGCRCCAEFASGEAAMRGISAEQPEVILMDINMPGLNGIECVRQLKAVHPNIEFIMLTVYEDAERVFESLAVGASGYLLKQATPDELLLAIRQVHSGGSPMTSVIARKVVQAFRRPIPVEDETAQLSARQQEVLELLARGYLYKEIAQSLGLEYATVHNYIRRIYEKLRVRSRTQAVAKYFENPRRRASMDPTESHL